MPSRTRAIVLATASDQPDITASDRLYADALERHGFSVVGAPWDGPRAAFDGVAAVVIRSTWGYYRASDAFRDWAEAMAAGGRLFNPIGLVRWNLRKDYMGKLAAASVRVPQTHFVACEVDAIAKVFARNRLEPRRGQALDRCVGLFGRTGGARGGCRRGVAARRGGARERRAGAGVPARDRRRRAVADLFRRDLQPRRAQASAAGRIQGQLALRRDATAPRRRRAR